MGQCLIVGQHGTKNETTIESDRIPESEVSLSDIGLDELGGPMTSEPVDQRSGRYDS